MKVAHWHKHEYDSPDIFDVGIAVHVARIYVMTHAADMFCIGTKAAHEHRHEYDSPDTLMSESLSMFQEICHDPRCRDGSYRNESDYRAQT